MATPVKFGPEIPPDFPIITSALFIEIPSKVLRKLYGETISCIVDTINSTSEHVTITTNERLMSRIQKEISRAHNGYRRLKSGHQKSVFDSKVRNMSVYPDEISTSTPLKLNTSSVRLDNSSSSSQRRLMTKLEDNVSMSLDFVETFGVLPKQVVFESFDGKESVIYLDGRKNTNVGYEFLTSVQKNEVKQMAELCDKNMISHGVYHELSMHIPSMNRSHHLAEYRKQLDSTLTINRTPGMIPGSYLSINEELEKYAHDKLAKGSLPEKFSVKISGDGTRVSRVSNYVLMSFSVIEDESNNHLSQKVFAIVNCDENYENLKLSLKPVLEEIIELNAKKKISVGDTTVDVDLFIGGDMKFIQLLLGLNGSTATYACPWCKVSKEKRSDMSYDYLHYHNPQNCRRVAEMTTLLRSSSKPKDSFGSKHPPLLDIEVDHYVPDELHLLLRIGDVLVRNVINDARGKDEYAKVTNTKDPSGKTNADLLVDAINACGVRHFKVWTGKNGEPDYTSLTGNDMKKVLRNLPKNLSKCLHEDTRDMVIKLWNDFTELYSAITSTNSVIETDLFEQSKQFIEDFLAIGKMKRLGYAPHNVTPYMHVLVYHVPVFVSAYGSFSKFSGQSVEKTNDVIKKLHQSKTNKWDATSDALHVRKRMEKCNVREKRKYDKLNSPFWNDQKSKNCKKIRDQIVSEMQEANKDNESSCDIESMSVDELKAKLRCLNVPFKVRKKEKLVQLLKSAMNC